MDLRSVLASKDWIHTLSSLWIVQSHPPWNEQFQLSPLAELWGKLKPEIGLRGVSSSGAGAVRAGASRLLATQTLHPETYLTVYFFQILPDLLRKRESVKLPIYQNCFLGDIPKRKALLSFKRFFFFIPGFKINSWRWFKTELPGGWAHLKFLPVPCLTCINGERDWIKEMLCLHCYVSLKVPNVFVSLWNMKWDVSLLCCPGSSNPASLLLRVTIKNLLCHWTGVWNPVILLFFF